MISRRGRPEQGFTKGQLRLGIEKLRLLAEAYRRHDSPFCRFEPEYLSIGEDPDTTNHYFEELSAPHPEKRNGDRWTLELQQ